MHHSSYSAQFTGESRLGRKGQVTIPAAVRSALQLQRGDSVAFTLEGRQARLSRGTNVVQRTAGVLRSTARTMSAKRERALVESLIAEDVVRRMGGA